MAKLSTTRSTSPIVGRFDRRSPAPILLTLTSHCGPTSGGSPLPGDDPVIVESWL